MGVSFKADETKDVAILSSHIGYAFVNITFFIE